MPTLSDTLTRLAMARAEARAAAAPVKSRLKNVAFDGSNPGQLDALAYVPAGLRASAPLVVVLHGCTQSAAGYDAGSGWSALADRQGFALLYPEQRRANNANRCFNWFVPEDVARDGGEVASIRQMVITMIARHRLDPGRVFVTGLSAGGAMTAALLATSPDMFAGGAIIAGLPFGAAATLSDGLDRMRGRGLPTGQDLANRVRRAGGEADRFPRVSLWHGCADTVVSIANLEASVAQWCGVHGLSGSTGAIEPLTGGMRRVWRDRAGRALVEAVTIDAMGHGTPIDPRGIDGIGAAMPYMLDVGVASTEHIAGFWNLADAAAAAKPAPKPAAAPRALRKERVAPRAPEAVSPIATVTRIIEDALRSAGLMK